jgi:hypothetical protein
LGAGPSEVVLCEEAEDEADRALEMLSERTTGSMPRAELAAVVSQVGVVARGSPLARFPAPPRPLKRLSVGYADVVRYVVDGMVSV